MDGNDVILIIWITVFGNVSFRPLLTVMAAAATLVTVLLLFVLGFLSFALLVVAFFFSLLFSLVILGAHDVGVPFFSPLVLGLQLLWVVVYVKEVKVAVLVMSQPIRLGLDPGSASELIVVQELVAENVLILNVGNDELSPGLSTIGEWMGTWSVLVRVKQFEYNLLTLSMGTFSGLNADED
jgi:hypothetical protein